MARDERKKYELLLAGWSVIIIWECEIKKDIKACVDRIKNAVAK
jgi:G:T-mismatch repair DNA endonuclease (very short patch repair protein)